MSLTEPDNTVVEPDAGQDTAEHVAASLYRIHLFTARHLAALARALEDERAGNADEDSIRRHRAYVIASVLASSAFLEASINELYLEVQEHLLNGERGGRRVLAVPAHFWSPTARPPILHKYQLALVVADAEPFDESRSPFRDADGLIALRDALVHGRPPDWRDQHGRRQNLERRLRAKYKHNALCSDADPAFPDRLLSAGCAEWAVRIAERFSSEFCHRMGIPSRGVAARE